MAWTNDPKIRDLEPYAKKHGFRQVIVLAVSAGDLEFEVISYGNNKKQCGLAKKAADEIYDLVIGSEIPIY